MRAFLKTWGLGFVVLGFWIAGVVLVILAAARFGAGVAVAFVGAACFATGMTVEAIANQIMKRRTKRGERE